MPVFAMGIASGGARRGDSDAAFRPRPASRSAGPLGLREPIYLASQLASICEHNPRFGYEFMKRTALALATRLSATRLQLLDIFGDALPTVAHGQEA